MDEQGVKPGKDLLDRTWDFFASVPVATVLIFVTAIASIGGTLIEQEGQYSSYLPPEEYYPQRYGPVMGLFLLRTGMTHMYSSWWYLTLLFMIGASLIICSLERFVPLWRAVQRPNPTPDEGFVKRLKHQFTVPATEGGTPYAGLAAALRARHYLVIERDGRLYADKGRWGRWGPYITHIGLILVLAGAMMRAIPGAYMDQFIWVKDGEIVRVPGTDFYVESLGFEAEYYESGAPKSYETHARILDANGNEVRNQTIAMNQPLAYQRVELYQSSFNTEPGTAVVTLVDRATGADLEQFEVDLSQPQPSYEVGGYRLEVTDYFPDFGIDENGQPTSRSSQIANPGLVLEVTPPTGEPFTTWFFVLYPEMEFDTATPVRFRTDDVLAVSSSGLKVKKDLGVPVIYLGLFVITLGVFATFYIAHRRYWALTEDGRVIVGGWTNRNPGSFVSEMQRIAHQVDPDGNPLNDLMEGEER